jgi:hypothetical protein
VTWGDAVLPVDGLATRWDMPTWRCVAGPVDRVLHVRSLETGEEAIVVTRAIPVCKAPVLALIADHPRA